MATVIQLPTLTVWANGGTMPTGQDSFGAFLDSDGSTAWLFQDFNSGFARINLLTNAIIFQGNIFGVPGGQSLDGRYDGTPMWLQDDAGHYYTQQAGTLYKLHVGVGGSSGDLGNGYLVTDATLAGAPTNIVRWFLFKSPANNTRYIVTMTEDSPNGIAYVFNADTMTLVGTFSPPQVPLAGQPDVSQTGTSVGAYLGPAGNIYLWFSDTTISVDNICNVVWNPNAGVTGGVLNVTQPEPNFALHFNFVSGQMGIKWITYLPTLNYVLMSNTEVFTSGCALIDMNPLPATVLGFFFDNDVRALYCGTFDVTTSAFDVGTQNNNAVIALPGDIPGSTVQVGGIVNLINPSNTSLPLLGSYNVTQLINSSPNVTNTVPPDVTAGRGDVSITSASADGVHATYIASNSFAVGQRVTTTFVTPSTLNVDNVVITAASPTQFSVALPVTQSSTPQTAKASVTFAPLANMRYSAARNAVLVTYEYVGSPAYWVILTGPPPVIGGNFQDLEGNPLANGYLTFKLTADAQITGIGQLGSGVITTVPLDATGNATGLIGVWPNNQLVPTDTEYEIVAYSVTGQPVWQTTRTIPSTPSPFPLQD